MRIKFVATTLAVLCVAASAQAQDGRASSDEQFDLLERQIRSVKTDLLDLEADMLKLEENVRYPEAQRWTVFLTGPEVDSGRLYSVQLSVNGSVVATHNYSETESRALTQGGAHKIYIAALAAGQYNVSIQVQDHLGNRSAAYQVEKANGPQILNLKWTAAGGTQPFQAESLADRS